MILSHKLWNNTNIPHLSETPKLVLLHGMGGTGSLWRPLAAGLEDKMAILAPDQRGHGASQISVPSRYSPLDYGQDIVDTMKSLAFHPSWILGHSMGARTALAAAHLCPGWTQGLILVDHGFSGDAGGDLRDFLSGFIGTIPMQFKNRDEARKYMDEHCPDPSIGQYLIAVSIKTPDGLLTFPFDRAALVQTVNSAMNSPVRDWVRELAEKNIPMLILRGERSLVWSHEEFLEEKDRFSKFPKLRFEEVANAGHGLPFEQRAYLVRELERLVLD